MHEKLCQLILKNTPVLKHPPQVENRGPSDIESAEVYILWPSLRGLDQPLLYLTGQPIVEGPGSCHYVSDVNIHNIKVSDVNALLRDSGILYVLLIYSPAYKEQQFLRLKG